MSDIKVRVSLEGTAEFEAATKRLDDEVRKLGKGAGAAGAESKSFGQQLTGNLIPAFTAATLAADVIRGGFRFLKNEVRETIEAAIDAEKIDRALESSLQIVGQAAGGTAETLKRYASALQRKTVYDDEAIKSAQALIIQMRGTASQVDVLTKGAIGLASVFGMDLQSAARAVAQGFDGNYRAIGMLIPQVRMATTDGEKHAAMMKGLAGYYQRAESDITTFAGKVDQVKNAYDDLQETLGNMVIKNKSVLESLNGIKSIIEWLDMQAKKSEGGGKKASILDYFGPVALWNGLSSAISATGKAAQKTVDDYAKSWEGYTASFLETRGVIIDSIPIIVDLRTKFKLLDTAIDAMPWGRHRGLLELVNKQLYETTTIIEGQLPVVSGYSHAVDDAARHVALLAKELEKLAPAVVEAMSGAEKAQIAFAGINDIVAQGQRNREIALDNEYKKRLAIIEATIKDEAARQQAIMALEAEFELKKSSARRKWAVAEKAAAISQAYINASLAVTKTLGQTGIFGIPLATIIWAACVAQIALIAKQPIPLAKGAFFKRETILAGRDADYRLSDNIGHEEIVSPVPMMRRIVREEMRGGGAGGGNCYITLAAGAVTIKAQTLGDAEIRDAGNRIFREMESQARLRGFKLRGN